MQFFTIIFGLVTAGADFYVAWNTTRSTDNKRRRIGDIILIIMNLVFAYLWFTVLLPSMQ
jgi:hypothetical protein